MKIYREYSAIRNQWEFTIFTRLVGKGVRFDIELHDDEVDNPSAMSVLMAQLPHQMMDIIERNMEFGHPWFAIDRTSTAGISTADGKIRSYIMLGQEYHELEVTEKEGPYEHKPY